jgi:uncharacterized iron-regulated membrane protein
VRGRARTVWLKVHLYLALTLGTFVAVLALTGAVLTFHPEIDGVLVPSAGAAPDSAVRIGPQAAADRVAQELGYRPALIWMPRPDSPAYAVEATETRSDVFHLVTVDPIGGQILADRVWGRTFITFLFQLHTTLFMGEFGFTFVGVLAIVLLTSIVTGLYLWWPRAGALRRAFLFRKTRAALPLNFEMHRIGGLYASLVLLVVAVTGIYLALPAQYEAVVGLFARFSPDPESQRVLSGEPASAATRPLSIDEIAGRATARAQGGRLASIQLPIGPRDPYRVRYVDLGEPANRNGRSTAWFDQYDGRLLKVHAYSQMQGADRFLALHLPLHTGEALGLGGRILVSLSGLVVCLLYVTGLYLWWKRRRPRSAALPARISAPESRP